MELRVPRLTHTFLCMVVVFVLVGTPITHIAHAYDDAPGDTQAAAETPVATAVTQASGEAQLESFVFRTTIQIGGFVAWLGGVTLEFAFSRFVMKLGCYFSANPGGNCNITGSGAVGDGGRVGGVVDELWKIIRDLFNVIFIFALIYIGFRIILGSDDSGAKKSLVNLIYAALIVNFSLYIAKFVLDIANFTAVQIYSAFSIGGVYSITSGTEGVQDLIFSEDYGIASAFMETLQVASFFESGGVGEEQSLLFGVMAMFFLIFLGFIFLYGAFMIFARFIAIILLLILSPAMFLGLVLPSFKSYSSKWRKMFVAYAFFAPVYVFMLYLSLYILKQLEAGLGQGKLNQAFQEGGNPDSVAIYVFLFIGMGFLFASTKVAGAMSQGGAAIGMNAASDWAKRLSVGAAAIGGGYAATAGLGLAGKGMISTADAIQSRTGTALGTRGLRTFGEKTKNKKIAGVNASAALKNYNDTTEKANKAADGLKNTRSAIITLKDDTASTANKEKALKSLGSSGITELAKASGGEDILKANAALLRPEHVKAIQDDKEIDKGTKKTILTARGAAIKADVSSGRTKVGDLNEDKLAALDLEFLQDEANAINLSEGKIDKLPQLVASEKEVIKNTRKEAIKNVIIKGATIGGVTTSTLLGRPADELAALPADVFDQRKGATPAEQGNIRDFVGKLPLSALGSIQTKKGQNVAQEMRKVLEFKARTDPKTKKWLDDSPIGQNFGI